MPVSTGAVLLAGVLVLVAMGDPPPYLMGWLPVFLQREAKKVSAEVAKRVILVRCRKHAHFSRSQVFY